MQEYTFVFGSHIQRDPSLLTWWTVPQGWTLWIDPRLRRVNLVRYIFVSILVLVQNVNIFIGVRRVELAYLRQYEHSWVSPHLSSKHFIHMNRIMLQKRLQKAPKGSKKAPKVSKSLQKAPKGSKRLQKAKIERYTMQNYKSHNYSIIIPSMFHIHSKKLQKAPKGSKRLQKAPKGKNRKIHKAKL